MNSITIAGKLIKDPEFRTTQAGDNITTFTVGEYCGMNQDGSYKPAPIWNCQIWDKRGDIIRDRCKKGTYIVASGRLIKKVWADQQGNQREGLNLKVSEFDIPMAQGGAEPQARQHAPSGGDDDGGGAGEGDGWF